MTNQMIGQVLQDRYQIVQPLSAGVFAQTFIAVDMYHPEKPRYVVKQLKVNHQIERKARKPLGNRCVEEVPTANLFAVT
jgi:hypothetical protein